MQTPFHYQNARAHTHTQTHQFYELHTINVKKNRKIAISKYVNVPVFLNLRKNERKFEWQNSWWIR